MNKVKIVLNKKTYSGVFDFYVIRKVQQDLEEAKLNCTVHHIFKNLSNINNLNNLDAHVTINSIVLHSLIRNGYEEEEIYFNFTKDLSNPSEFLQKVYEYIYKLLEKNCSQNKSKTEDDEYEVPDWYVPKDWDFNEMEYLWYSVLKRTDDFYKVTHKTFSAQMDIFEKVNSKK